MARPPARIATGYAPELVADVTEDHRAERARDIGDAEGCEGGDGRHLRVEGREEDLAEHQRGGGAVDEEVVVLDGAADPACKRRLARRANGRGAVVGGGGSSGHGVS